MKAFVLLLLASVLATAAPNQVSGLRLQPHRAITRESLEEMWLEYDLMRDGWTVTIGQEGLFSVAGRAKRPGPEGLERIDYFKDLGTPKVRLILLRLIHHEIHYPPRPEEPDIYDGDC